MRFKTTLQKEVKHILFVYVMDINTNSDLFPFKYWPNFNIENRARHACGLSICCVFCYFHFFRTTFLFTNPRVLLALALMLSKRVLQFRSLVIVGPSFLNILQILHFLELMFMNHILEDLPSQSY